MVTLTALSEYMVMGQQPKWSPALTMRLGEELRDLLHAGEPLPAERPNHPSLALDPPAVDPVRDILIAFGALDPEDDVTGTLDLLACLLPPAANGA